ncbi:NAD-dependent epimerase/dehydratase family protein [Sulfuricella sp.]|uniref:NAD-dependent epimerase/dehydratase family protein n=1 Tax=Sulfuricella sp. TaxID=2099377 RepID=UPI002B77F956|nr:NAD-dependent epimerase/dehydratase family protein [Sulfuricella sp.]HUX65234.1 NAD-dependent epimerase/dehydratase family protein [Sulfuricella sp.]
MRILILGGCGFIGSHVVDELIASGHEVVVFDRYPERFRSPLPDVQFCQADFGNRGELEEVLAGGIDVVIHLVSSTAPQSSNDDPIFDVQTNLVESIALFEMCIKHHVRKVVFISSGGTVYGVPQASPVPETHPTLPLCSYGITKLAIENYLHLFHLLHGLEYVVLRVSNPYGTRQDPHRKQGAAAVFMYKILKGERINVWGDGSIVRDFVHVSDVARACLAAAESQYVGMCNVGSGTGLSIKQLIVALQEVTGKKANVNWLESRNFDVPEIVLDCSRIERELSWRPQTSLQNGLVDMQNWMITNIKSTKL